jgi:hypothetical protein
MLVAKTGRPKRGEVREERILIAPRITADQKSKLDWLVLQLKISVAELIGRWIEQVFASRGGSLDMGDCAHSRAVAFVCALAQGRKPEVLEIQLLADEIGVPSEKLAALVAKCCCETEEQKSGKTRS